MDQETLKIASRSSTALGLLNKMTTGICAFLVVLLINDVRTDIKDVQSTLKANAEQFSSLNTRITLIEYMLRTPTPNKPQSSLPLKEKDDKIVLYKPEEEYEFSKNI